MSINIIKYLINETKYSLRIINMKTRIIFIMGCIILFALFFQQKESLDEGQTNLYFVIISNITAFVNNQYNFFKDSYQMLPFSKKEYQWLLILEGVPLHFVLSGIVAVFTLPAIIITGNLHITGKCFIYVLSIGLWYRHVGWIKIFFENFQVTKEAKGRIYGIMECIISLLYFAVFIFNIETEINVYLSVLLSLSFIFIILAAVGIMRKHWVNKLLGIY